MGVPARRGRRSGGGERGEPGLRIVTSTEAKNAFAGIVRHAEHQGPVVVQTHGVPRVVVVAYEEFARRARERRERGILEELEMRFEARIAAMQGAEAGERVEEALFDEPIIASIGTDRGGE